MFEALYNSRVNINMISTSEIRITVLVAEKDIDKAMNAVHDEFIMGRITDGISSQSVILPDYLNLQESR